MSLFIHPHYPLLCNTTDWRWRIIKSLFCKPWIFFLCNIQKAVLQMKYCTLQLQESIETTRYTGILGPRWFWFGRCLCAFRSFIFSRKVKWTMKDNVALSDCWAPTDWPLVLPSQGEKYCHFWNKCIIKEYYCNGIDIKAIENGIERLVRVLTPLHLILCLHFVNSRF